MQSFLCVWEQPPLERSQTHLRDLVPVPWMTMSTIYYTISQRNYSGSSVESLVFLICHREDICTWPDHEDVGTRSLRHRKWGSKLVWKQTLPVFTGCGLWNFLTVSAYVLHLWWGVTATWGLHVSILIRVAVDRGKFSAHEERTFVQDGQKIVVLMTWACWIFGWT